MAYGFTLIELVLVCAVLALLVTAGIPSLTGLLERHRLHGAAENLYHDLMLARSEAVRLNTPVSVTFRLDPILNHWCYAMSDAGPCDCFRPYDCSVSGAPSRQASDAVYQRVLMSTNLRQQTATFHPARGTANAGTITFAAGEQNVAVIVSTLGRVRLCADYPGVYPQC